MNRDDFPGALVNPEAWKAFVEYYTEDRGRRGISPVEMWETFLAGWKAKAEQRQRLLHQNTRNG